MSHKSFALLVVLFALAQFSLPQRAQAQDAFDYGPYQGVPSVNSSADTTQTAPQPEGVASKSPSGDAARTLDPTNLNSHFVWSAAAGTLADKNKTMEEIYKHYLDNPHGVRGAKGIAHESGVVCMDEDCAPVINETLRASRLYEKPNLPDDWTKTGAYMTYVHFFVRLRDETRLAATIFDKTHDASPDRVTVEKFLLADDQGNMINAIPEKLVSSSDTGMMSYTVDHTSTDYYSYDDSDGSHSFSTTSTIPEDEQHPYYQSDYLVYFPLFDKAGKPLITKATKMMTLHIITKTDEQAVDFPLK